MSILDAGWETIEQAGGYWRPVNHAERRAGTGFGTREAVVRNLDLYRDSASVRDRQRQRYIELF